MLLPEQIHPENSIYYNGALVLSILQNNNVTEMLELYNSTNKVKPISFPTFILCLDWLYLINAAKLENGVVELCS